MRILSTVLLLALVPNVAFAQGLTELKVPIRHGVGLNTRAFVQTTPKETLTAIIKAVDENRFDVLVAHLMEEKIVDARAAEHGRTLEPEAEKSLQLQREKQKADPFSVPKGERLPNEPVAFAALVQEEAKARGFKATIEEVRKKYASDYSLIKELKRFLRDGDFVVTGETAKVTLKGVPGKGIYFTLANGRWFAEDRQEEKAEKKP